MNNINANYKSNISNSGVQDTTVKPDADTKKSFLKPAIDASIYDAFVPSKGSHEVMTLEQFKQFDYQNGATLFSQKKDSFWVKRAEREKKYVELTQARSIEKFKANTKIEMDNRVRVKLGLYEKHLHSTGVPAAEMMNLVG